MINKFDFKSRFDNIKSSNIKLGLKKIFSSVAVNNEKVKLINIFATIAILFSFMIILCTLMVLRQTSLNGIDSHNLVPMIIAGIVGGVPSIVFIKISLKYKKLVDIYETYVPVIFSNSDAYIEDIADELNVSIIQAKKDISLLIKKKLLPECRIDEESESLIFDSYEDFDDYDEDENENCENCEGCDSCEDDCEDCDDCDEDDDDCEDCKNCEDRENGCEGCEGCEGGKDDEGCEDCEGCEGCEGCNGYEEDDEEGFEEHTVKCQNCGALNTLVAKSMPCEYCGSLITEDIN
ncbi:MAG: hypothetical protein ACRC76_00695 [Proteocatella sp.]